jgi:plasmid stability protein
MEEEVREILRQAVGGTAPPRDLGRAIHERFAAIGGVELELPARDPMREPPTFERTARSSSTPMWSRS